MNKSPTLLICLSTGKGGMDMDTAKLARLLAHNTHLNLICRKNTSMEEQANKDAGPYGYEVTAISYSQKASLKLISIRLLRAVSKLIKQQSIKNIIFFGSSELKSLYFSFVGKDLNVIMRHATTKGRKRDDWYHRPIYQCVKKHVAISQHIARNIKAILPYVAAENIKVIYPSLRFQPLRQVSNHAGKINILHSGRIAPGKGHYEVIESCSVLYDAGIAFQVDFLGDFGEQSYVDPLYDYINSQSFKDVVNFHGHIDNVDTFLAEADIFLFPSYGEGFCNSFNEALACGVPCIAYDNSAFPELKDNGFYVHLVPDRNVELLKKKLLEVIGNINEEKQLAQKNLALAKKLYNEKVEMEAFLDLLS